MIRKTEMLRCPEDMLWLREMLQKENLKAYNSSISVSDPKNRKSANEVIDWCKTDGFNFKLWSISKNKFVKEVVFEKTRIQSMPTNH